MADSTSRATGEKTLPVLPLRNGVVFPHMVVTLRIETAEGKGALQAAGDDGELTVRCIHEHLMREGPRAGTISRERTTTVRHGRNSKRGARSRPNCAGRPSALL